MTHVIARTSECAVCGKVFSHGSSERRRTCSDRCAQQRADAQKRESPSQRRKRKATQEAAPE